tara:strand:- start:551 stop:796 length:246 start_codon:yes stop_codon:yes gene_type:complete
MAGVCIMGDKKWNEYVHEAKIIQFPRKPVLADRDMGFIIALEEELHKRLIGIHKGQVDDVPIESVATADQIIDMVEDLLRH